MTDNIPNARLCPDRGSHAPKMSPDAFLIDGVLCPAYLRKPLLQSWIAAADAHGFDIVGRVIGKDHLVLRCRDCRTDFIVRWSVVRDANPLCYACIWSRHVAEAQDLGIELIAPAGDHRHYGIYGLPCGHTVRRQYQTVARAPLRGHSLDCPNCRESRYAKEALGFGWTLTGQPAARKQGYRQYRHSCGHVQDVSIGNMVWGDCSCAGCGNAWNAKPSYIYLFTIDLPGLPVVKLRYSARPAKRLRHQLNIAPGVEARVELIVRMPSGNVAVQEEKTCHRILLTQHPDLVVPKTVFGKQINTQGEIYHAAASPLIHALLEDFAKRFPPDQPPAVAIRATSATPAAPATSLI